MVEQHDFAAKNKGLISGRSKLWFQIIIMVGLVGMITSSYLVYDHHNPSENSSAICDLATKGGCRIIKQSQFSELLNVPVSVFGVLWHVTLLGLCLAGMTANRREVAAALLAWSALGIVFVFYLIFAEVMLKAICPFCTLVHITSAIIFYAALRIYKNTVTTPPSLQEFSEHKFWIGVVAFAFLIPVIVYNTPAMAQHSPRGAGVSPVEHEPLVERLSTSQYKNRMEDFAKCLTVNGLKMFGSDMCGHCKAQKKLFGDAFSQIAYVECRQNADQCSQNKIHGYPTWIKFDADGKEEKRDAGRKPLEWLGTWAGGDCANFRFDALEKSQDIYRE